jgi:hypothetical protein
VSRNITFPFFIGRLEAEGVNLMWQSIRFSRVAARKLRSDQEGSLARMSLKLFSPIATNIAWNV